MTVSQSLGTLGLWDGDEEDTAGRVSGQRQENESGYGEELPAISHCEERVPEGHLCHR